MPQRLRNSLVPQGVLNALAAALLLVTAPLLSSAVEENSSAVEDHPPAAAVALNDSDAAEELAPQLPLVLTFTDRMGAAEFAQLPAPLDIDGAAGMSGYRAGDIGYVASEQSIVVFLSEGTAAPDGDLVLVGHVTSGLDVVAGCARGCALQLVVADGIADADDR